MYTYRFEPFPIITPPLLLLPAELSDKAAAAVPNCQMM